MSAPEAFIPLNGSAGNSAPVTGGKRKLKLVTRKQARKLLKKMGKKMRGGQPGDLVAATGGKIDPVTGVDDGMGEGGRRRRTGKTRRGKRRSLFGLKY
jgi:hypothetical protein